MSEKFKILAERLKLLRLQKGVSQKVVSMNIGIDDSSYRSLELGRANPSLPVLLALADYYKVSLDYLCGRDSYLL
jgi:transcriptional regulator with XRE-family HTH domain